MTHLNLSGQLLVREVSRQWVWEYLCREYGLRPVGHPLVQEMLMVGHCRRRAVRESFGPGDSAVQLLGGMPRLRLSCHRPEYA